MNESEITRVTLDAGTAIDAQSMSVVDPTLRIARLRGASISVEGQRVIVASSAKKSLGKILGWEELGHLFTHHACESVE